MAFSTSIILGGTNPSTAIVSIPTLLLAASGPKAIIQAAGEAVLQLSSSDVDDQPSDTGAGSVYIEGYSVLGLFLSETVDLNAQSAVNTVNLYATVTRFEIASSGATGVNEGDIYLAPDSQALTTGVPDANVIHVIGANDGRARLNQFKVPLGHSASVRAATCSAAGGTVTCIVQVRASASDPWLDVARFVATDAAGTEPMPILRQQRLYGGEVRVVYEDAAGSNAAQIDVEVNLTNI